MEKEIKLDLILHCTMVLVIGIIVLSLILILKPYKKHNFTKPEKVKTKQYESKSIWTDKEIMEQHMRYLEYLRTISP